MRRYLRRSSHDCAGSSCQCFPQVTTNVDEIRPLGARQSGGREVRRMGRALWHSFSTCGLLLGMLFFAASLTPTLLPRSFLTQGVLSGCSLAAGYGIGVFGRWLWAYME